MNVSSNAYLEEKDIYIVEKIIDKKIIQNKVFYQIKWRHYPESENTWEPSEHLINCQNLVNEFEENQSKKVDVFKHGKEEKMLKKKRNNIDKKGKISEETKEKDNNDNFLADGLSEKKEKQSHSSKNYKKRYNNNFEVNINIPEKNCNENSEKLSYIGLEMNLPTNEGKSSCDYSENTENINPKNNLVDKKSLQEGKISKLNPKSFIFNPQTLIKSDKEMQKIKRNGEIELDEPNKIVNIKLKGNQLECIVEWKSVNENIILLDSSVDYITFKKKYKLMIIDYLEERLVFIEDNK